MGYRSGISAGQQPLPVRTTDKSDVAAGETAQGNHSGDTSTKSPPTHLNLDERDEDTKASITRMSRLRGLAGCPSTRWSAIT